MKLLRELGKGMYSTSYLYENDDGEKVVIKKPNPKCPLKSPLLNYRKEANITQKLQDKHQHTSVMYINRDSGNWLIISSYVAGEYLTQELLDSLSEAKYDKVAADLAEFLLTLHTLPIAKQHEKFSDL